MITLSIEEAVDRIERAINNGCDAFFVNTQLGKLAIETDDNYDPLDPTSVIDWASAPPTQWCMKHRGALADYYCLIGINSKPSKLSIKMHVIEAITKCMFVHILGITPSPEIIDAGIQIYCENHKIRNNNLNLFEKEFCNLNLSMLCKNDKMVKDVVRELIRRRMNESSRIIETVRNSYVPTGYDNEVQRIRDIDFNDEYLRDMFGLVIYAANRNGINNRIEQFASVFMGTDEDDINLSQYELSVIPI